ncbi:hypothetical protein [Lonsdalea britannica]|uniref:hypothetical protein n=1 Tax=Lonsdalea britannica TaxID=1082704 RepID=UPI0026EBD141|nr:hypothetical protein [Lonsdalea britannica]
MSEMKKVWWRDIDDRDGVWQGLALESPSGQRPSGKLQLLVGAQGRAQAICGDDTLFWAVMAMHGAEASVLCPRKDIRQQSLLSPIRSADVMRAGAVHSPTARQAGWCRFFAERLLSSPQPLLNNGQWLLRPMPYVLPAAPRTTQPQPINAWRFHAPQSAGEYCPRWDLFGEDIPDLTASDSVFLIDRWWDSTQLLPLSVVDPASSRVKWWRKKAREGALPPILLWFVSGLGAYVILDGHSRLQAARDEGVPPLFIVLSGLYHQRWKPDVAQRQRVVDALARQQQSNPKLNQDAINQTLINAYDDRGALAGTTYSRVTSLDERWQREVKAYLCRYSLTEHLAHFGITD